MSEHSTSQMHHFALAMTPYVQVDRVLSIDTSSPCGSLALSAISKKAAILIAGLLLAGCAANRDSHVVPEVTVPKQFRQTRPPVAEKEDTPEVSPETPIEDSTQTNVQFIDEMLAEWWRILGSKELDALMDQTIANNADMRIATLRIVQAKVRFEQAGADQWPVVTMPYSARIEAPAGGVGSVLQGQPISSRRVYQGGLRGDWRLDVWGEREALTESSRMQLWRAIYQRDETRRKVLANIASQYVEYLSLNDRLRVARETEIVLRGMLEAVEGRLKGGDATITELEQQRAAVHSVRATIPGIQLQRENAINGLAQLLGVTSGSLSLSRLGMDSLLFPRVLPGVPANLLLRRPDVRAVESQLLAADADIDVARARLLPAIDLTSQLGYGSLIFSRLLQPHNLAWNIIGNLSTTIFDHGKRTNEVVFARALHEELVETYARVLYSAIRETEDAIATVQMNSKRLEAQNSATKASKRAWNFSIEAYREGAIDYLTLLDTERTYHRNLDEMHRVSMERYKGLVSLFSSLGGGIQKNAPAPTRGDPPAGVLGDEYTARVAAQAPIQFSPHSVGLDKDHPFWLVELAGLQDRGGVAHVWRDLMHRFPDLMSERVILPRMQGRVIGSGQEEKTAWYRLFVAKFDTKARATEFCARLSAALIRCRALSSDSSSYQEVVQTAIQSASTEQAMPQVAAETRHIGTRPVTTRRIPMEKLRGSAMTDQPLRIAPVESTAMTEIRAEVRATSVDAAFRETKPAPGSPAEVRRSDARNVQMASSFEASDMRNLSTRTGYAVQLATFSSEANAANAAQKWKRRGYETYLYAVARPSGSVLYSVRTGVYASQALAAEQAAAIRRSEQTDAVPVPVTLDESGAPAPAVAITSRIR